MRQREGQTQFSLRVSQDSDCFIGLDRRRVYPVARLLDTAVCRKDVKAPAQATT